MPTPSRHEYFAELTGVRAIAAYALFLYHFNPFSPHWLGGLPFRLNHEMYLGVNVFYVLSGFLIYYRYGQSLATPSPAFLGQYARNRFARIYPVYFVILSLTYLWEGGPDLRQGLATYTLTQAFFPDLLHAGIPQAWTLTIEETFYFTAPLIFLLVRRGTVILPCVLFVALAWLLGTTPFPGNPYYGELGHLLGRTLGGTIICFACGMALAQVVLRWPQRIDSNRLPLFTYGGLAACLLLVLFVSHLGQSVEARLPPGEIARGRDHPSVWPILFGLFPLLVALLFYGLITERSLLKRLLSSKLLILLGGSSYCFYLVHVGVIQQLIFQHVSTNYLVLFGLLNILSILIFEGFEKPVGRWLKSFGGQPLPAPEPSTVPLARPDRLVPYLLVAGLIALVWLWPLAAQHQGRLGAVAALLAEDGIYESAEAMLCLASLALCLCLALPTSATTGLAPRQRFWIALLGLMFLAMLGEEISWGQRLLGYRTPDWIARQNYQGEFTLHNWNVFQPADEGNRLQNAWLAVMLAYVGVLPLAAVMSRRVWELLRRIGLPLASLPVSALFLASLAMHVYKPDQSEVLELQLNVVLLAFVIELASGVAPGRAAWRRAAVALATLPALLLGLAIWLHAADLPTVASLKLLDEGTALLRSGHRDAALDSFRRAVDVWPNNVEARYQLASLLVQAGNRDEARQQLEEVVLRAPRRVDALVLLATVLVDRGDHSAAAQRLRQALAEAPQSAEIASNLALILAAGDDQIRDGAEAVRLAEQACRTTSFRHPLALNTLAAAYAEVGRYDDAVATAQRAYRAAVDARQSDLASRIEDRMRRYQRREPYRLPTP
jgi:peptidoglycan/LPS O-acetylase OafA/YrhL/cytochrome c-type biogenesis protein CcmH/NrfG